MNNPTQAEALRIALEKSNLVFVSVLRGEISHDDIVERLLENRGVLNAAQPQSAPVQPHSGITDED